MRRQREGDEETLGVEMRFLGSLLFWMDFIVDDHYILP